MKLDKTLIITSSLYSKEDDESNKGVWDYNGQSLINEWKGLSLELFRDKKEKEKTNEVRSLMHLVIFPVV